MFNKNVPLEKPPAFRPLSPFAGINEADVSTQSSYMPAGFLGTVKVASVKLQESKKVRGKLLYIVAFRVESSETPQLVTAGEERAWFVNMANQSSMGSVKAFISAVGGLDPEDTTEDYAALAELSVSSAQPLSGYVVRLKTVAVTKKDGGEFTVHNWYGPGVAPGDETAAPF